MKEAWDLLILTLLNTDNIYLESVAKNMKMKNVTMVPG